MQNSLSKLLVKFFFILQLIILNTTAFANEKPVNINPETPAQALGQYMEFLVDVPGALTFEAIQQEENWQQVEGDSIIGRLPDYRFY